MIKPFLVMIIIFLLCFFIFNNVENFVGVKLVNDFYVSDDVHVNINDKSINTRKICIFKRDQSTQEITDYECIDANELISTLKLPKGRKEQVCLDGNCLNKSDIKLLNGEESFKILNKFQFKNFTNNCIGGHDAIKLKRCGSLTKVSWFSHFISNWWNKSKIYSSAPKDCESSNAWSFKFVPGENLDKNLKRNDIVEKSEDADVSSVIDYTPGHT